jgi:seryl-tRNA synthetase
MELKELLSAVAAYIADDDEEKAEAKAKELAKELRNNDETKPVAVVLRNAGAASKKGEAQKRERELTEELEALKKERDELQGQIDTAASAPNERITALEKERDKYKAKAEEVDRKWKDEQVGRRQDRVGTRVETIIGSLRGEVDDDYAEEVLRPRIAKRLRPQEQGEGIEALEEDGTPMDGDEKAQLQSLRASVLKVVPDKYRLRQMVPGGGAGNRGGQGTVTKEQIEAEKRRTSRTYQAL